MDISAKTKQRRPCDRRREGLSPPQRIECHPFRWLRSDAGSLVASALDLRNTEANDCFCYGCTLVDSADASVNTRTVSAVKQFALSAR
jgi:hypothetical protein